MPQLVTFTFGGPPHRCPVCVAVGGQVVATVGEDFLPQATVNEHARCLGEVNDISYVDGKWRFIVEFADGIFSENIIARDVLDGSLSPVSPTDDWLMRKLSEFDDLAAVAFSGAYANLSGKPDLASQAEAEAGIEETKIMTPLRVAQAIDALAPPIIQEVTRVVAAGTHTIPVGDNGNGNSIASIPGVLTTDLVLIPSTNLGYASGIPGTDNIDFSGSALWTTGDYVQYVVVRP